MVKARVVRIENVDKAKEEIKKIGVYYKAIPFLYPKAVNICIKIENLSPWEAIIIKQEMLGKGGDVAVHKDVCRYTIEQSNILILGNINQYRRLIQKLQIQPFSLKEIGSEIKNIIDNIENSKFPYFVCKNYKVPIGGKTHKLGSMKIECKDLMTLEDEIEKLVVKAENFKHEIDILELHFIQDIEKSDSIVFLNKISTLINDIKACLNMPISIRASLKSIIETALNAGVDIISTEYEIESNITYQLASKHKSGIILNYCQQSTDLTEEDLIANILFELKREIKAANNSGINLESIMINPFDDGIRCEDIKNQLIILKNLKEFSTLGLPILFCINTESLIHYALYCGVNKLDALISLETLAVLNGAEVIKQSEGVESNNTLQFIDNLIRR